MNILYLIGNGFDLAQGLQTSYQHFYEYLKTQTAKNSVSELMLKEIQGPDKPLWSDMELALGIFTQKVTDKSLLEDFYYDLCDKLKTYLISQDESYTPKDEIKDKYIKDLVRPDMYLNERDRLSFRNFFNQFNDTRHINIVSFNYTRVFDKVIDTNNPQLKLPATGHSYTLHPIVNIHGRLNTPYMLMGVNDESQIKNTAFAQDEDIWDYLVKPRSNFEIGSLIDYNAEMTIMASNLIVTMGLSFGETDAKWWKHIGARLKNRGNIMVLLFVYIKDLPNDPRRHQPHIRKIRKDFLNKCGFEDDEHINYADKIFVCLNTGLFSPNTLINNDEWLGL